MLKYSDNPDEYRRLMREDIKRRHEAEEMARWDRATRGMYDGSREYPEEPPEYKLTERDLVEMAEDWEDRQHDSWVLAEHYGVDPRTGRR